MLSVALLLAFGAGLLLYLRVKRSLFETRDRLEKTLADNRTLNDLLVKWWGKGNEKGNALVKPSLPKPKSETTRRRKKIKKSPRKGTVKHDK